MGQEQDEERDLWMTHKQRLGQIMRLPLPEGRCTKDMGKERDRERVRQI